LLHSLSEPSIVISCEDHFDSGKADCATDFDKNKIKNGRVINIFFILINLKSSIEKLKIIFEKSLI
jgi:hypothetical protein